VTDETSGDVSRDTSSRPVPAPPAPESARGVFGSERLPLAVRFAELLADDGTVRGLIGPREVPRLWERHLINCAVLAELVPAEASVCDIGSGAGLPGIVLAIARPDLHVTLVEPLLRRTSFLAEVAAELGLTRCEVVRTRAEALHGVATYDVVTSRAVAPLPKLLAWSMPLVAPGGAVLAMKGSRAAEEVADASKALRRLGGAAAEVLEVGGGPPAFLEPATTVVRVVRAGTDVRG
jgi:16S rRNA (guanine527-N7)-methyltransferase